MTMPSRQFLITQAVLDAVRCYKPYELTWCTPAKKLDCYTSKDRTYVRDDLLAIILAEFRALVAKYEEIEAGAGALK